MASGDTSWDLDLRKRYEDGVNIFLRLMRLGNFGKKFDYFYGPHELLEASRESESNYNEVDVLGTNFSRTRYDEFGNLDYSKVRVDGFYIECAKKSAKTDLRDLFAGHVVVKLDPLQSDQTKKAILESCLSDSKERIDPKNGILDALVSQNRDDRYPIILSQRTNY